uniref:MerR family DNA-binding transcriptional regulator n=1 Tax=Schlesneria paludicola TaxID=360056 RepID=A0A7C2JZM4_9PLAN
MQFVSTRQLARAAGVSESSVKRWCDQGLIPSVKTAGGHRRVSLDAATEFLRRSTDPHVRPELLGVPIRRGAGPPSIKRAADEFFEALAAGDEELCRRIVFDLHLAGEPASKICDAVVAEAFHGVGAAWECDQLQVYQERRGCGLCLQLLSEAKLVIPEAKGEAPLAIGGTPQGDPYELPTAMVELVLRQNGWRSRSLGSRLPFETLLKAIDEVRPQLFWLSVSHIDDEAAFLDGYRQFFQQVPAEVVTVVGGRALTDGLRRQMNFAAHCDNLQQLEKFAEVLKRSLSRPGEPGVTLAAAETPLRPRRGSSRA